MIRPRAGLAVAAAAAAVLAARRRARVHGHGALARRLEQWEPAPLDRPVARIAAYVWAAPVTAAGLLAGAAAGVRPRVNAGVVVFAPVRGLVEPLLRQRRFHAGALGHVILARGEPTGELLAHELVHVRQAERLGPLMAPVYLGLLAVHGYARHPLERAAYRIAAAETGAAFS